MDFYTSTGKVSRRATDCIIVGVYQGNKLGIGAADIDAASNGAIRRHLKSGNISAGLGQCTVLTDVAGVRATRVAVVGLGKSGSFGVAHFRRAVAAAIQSISKSKTRDLLNSLTLERVADADAYYLARHSVQSIGDSLYRFTQMKSGKKRPAMPLKKIGLSIEKRGDAARAMNGADEHADGIVAGMSLAKDLGNLPPNVCTPSYLGRTAQRLAREHKSIQTRVIGEAEMKRLGMRSLLSVTAGAVEPAKLVVRIVAIQRCRTR